MKRNLLSAGLLLMAAAFTFTSCLSDGDDTIVLEDGQYVPTVDGIPSDDLADPNPDVNGSTTSIPNIQYEVETDGGDAIMRIDMTGIQDADDYDWLRLIGTGNPDQNVWVEVDGQPKGILVVNNADNMDEEDRTMVDLVFCVDNSGSMSQEADAIARDIISWSTLLANSNLNIRFGCVGYSVSGAVNGAINLTPADTLARYLNRSTGTSRTVGFFGLDASALQTAANSMGSTGDECGGMALIYADQNMKFRPGANRIYVNFTDEPNYPDGSSNYSTEFFKSQENWSTIQGTVHTVFSGLTSFSHNVGYSEQPWRISEYTGGTILYASSDFSDVTLQNLPVTGAMQNSYVIRFTNIDELMDGEPHEVTITILSADGKTYAERTFYVVFGTAE